MNDPKSIYLHDSQAILFDADESKKSFWSAEFGLFFYITTTPFIHSLQMKWKGLRWDIHSWLLRAILKSKTVLVNPLTDSSRWSGATHTWFRSKKIHWTCSRSYVIIYPYTVNGMFAACSHDGSGDDRCRERAFVFYVTPTIIHIGCSNVWIRRFYTGHYLEQRTIPRGVPKQFKYIDTVWWQRSHTPFPLIYGSPNRSNCHKFKIKSTNSRDSPSKPSSTYIDVEVEFGSHSIWIGSPIIVVVDHIWKEESLCRK